MILAVVLASIFAVTFVGQKVLCWILKFSRRYSDKLYNWVRKHACSSCGQDCSAHKTMLWHALKYTLQGFLAIQLYIWAPWLYHWLVKFLTHLLH